MLKVGDRVYATDSHTRTGRGIITEVFEGEGYEVKIDSYDVCDIYYFAEEIKPIISGTYPELIELNKAYS